MSNNTIRSMNNSLYAAAFHLLEASKYLSDVEEWKPAAGELLERANFLISIIREEPEKITMDKVNDILGEIMSLDTKLNHKETE